MMYLNKEFITGLILLTIAILGIVSIIPPLMSIKTEQVSYPYTDFTTLMARLLNVSSLVNLISIGMSQVSYEEELVMSKSFNVGNILDIVIRISNGAAIVETCNCSNLEVKITSVKIPLFTTSKEIHELSLKENVLNLSIKGLKAYIKIPSSVKLISVNMIIKGGGAKLSLDNYVNGLNLKALGSGIKLDVKRLANSSINIYVNGGGVEGTARYLDVKRAKSHSRLTVKGGGIKLKIFAPNFSVKFKGSCNYGGLRALIDGETIALGFSGSKSYTEEGYAKSLKKLDLDVIVCAGGADLWVIKH